MPDNPKQREIVTPEFRISFPSLFRPSGMQGSKPRYSLTMLAEKVNLKAWEPLRNRIREVIALNYEGTPPPAMLKKFSPFRDGDEEKSHVAGYKGVIFAKAACDLQPKVVDLAKQEILDEAKVYAGSYARAVVEVYWRKRKDNPGVSLGLVMVQWTRDGEPFGRSYGEPDDYFGDSPAADPKPDDKPDFF